METGQNFVGNPCKLTLRNGFVLYGVPRELTAAYVLFETLQKTTIISFIDIRSLELDPKFKR